MEDKEMIALISAQDQRGMEALMRRFGPLVRYVISPIVTDPGDAEECASEVFMRIWNGISLFDPDKGSLSGWITAIARNAALNRARKKTPEIYSGGISDDVPSPAPTPEEHILAQERQKELIAALSRLSAADRQLFYRKYYYLQPTAQIASEMGITERAAEGRLYRLKRQLRKMLGGEEHG